MYSCTCKERVVQDAAPDGEMKAGKIWGFYFLAESARVTGKGEPSGGGRVGKGRGRCIERGVVVRGGGGSTGCSECS